MNRPSAKGTWITSGPRAVRSRVEQGVLVVELNDGREVRAALERFPRLAQATPGQLGNVRLIGRGKGLHWPDLDEDLSIAGLMRDGRVVDGLRTAAPSIEKVVSVLLQSSSNVASTLSKFPRNIEVISAERVPTGLPAQLAELLAEAGRAPLPEGLRVREAELQYVHVSPMPSRPSSAPVPAPDVELHA